VGWRVITTKQPAKVTTAPQNEFQAAIRRCHVDPGFRSRIVAMLAA
jgi:hypothetical protein